MIGDNHNVTDLKLFVHAACRVRYEKCPDTEHLHDSDRECHLFHVVTFIIMETALHGHHTFAAKHTENQVAAVTLDCRDGEIGDFLVGNIKFIGDVVNEAAETGAEDYRYFRHIGDL